MMSRSAEREAICGEVIATPGARKSHAAFVWQGERILFMFPVDTPQEGEAMIGKALALLAQLKGAVRQSAERS